MIDKRLHIYLRTLTHIKLCQFAHFAFRLIFPVVNVAPIDDAIALRRTVGIIPCVPRTGFAESQNEFRFLNSTKLFDLNRMDWSCREMPKLWRYNLHYFDYIHEPYRSPQTIPKLITSWIDLNPPGVEDAWEPFTVSLRIVNWIKLFLQPEYHGRVEQGWSQSLYHQALWLEKNIENHLLANHYFKNGKALIFAGTFFDGADAERWLNKGLEILCSELNEQILPDGGHYERSPMYHAMILEDCLDLLNLGLGSPASVLGAWDSELLDKLKQTGWSMIQFLLGMSHPDGQISLFNDAAYGIEPTPAVLISYFERLTGEKVAAPYGDYLEFQDSGYFVMSPRAGDRMIIDCGPVGPEYQPGHSHCDMLSFELSLKGHRVIVDSGCCQYVDGDIRRYNRGNAGHNTVTVDGENQSEVWGAHRCARRARPLYGRLEKLEDGTLLFAGAHDGYRRLKGKPVHHRTITWSAETCLIEDRVEGAGSHTLESRLHINPALSVQVADGCAVIRGGVELLATISARAGGRIETADGWYCPEFGMQQPCTVITTRFSLTRLPFLGGWVIKTGNRHAHSVPDPLLPS